jgi:hypothetical protein
MPRKIYDIKPPKVVHKIAKESKESLVITRVKRTQEPRHSRNKKEGRHIWKPILFCILVVILIVGVYLFFKLPKADITIWPKVDTLSFKQTVTADKSVDSVDITKAVIPAKYLQVTKTSSQDFPATGNASNEGQASGTITIFNKFDPVMPFTFKAGTRFISDSGKLFIASQKIVVPAAKKSGSKITPGSISVKVQAVEGGESYNIAPSNFSVPGLKGTSYYYSIYATSTSPMSGGYAGKVKKVTDDDIQGAKDVLTKKTTADAAAALKSQVSSDYILLDSSMLSNTTSALTQTKSGTVADNFNYQVTVSASALAFAKSDLDQFARDYIISQVPEGKTLLDNSSKIDYSAGLVDVSSGKAVLNLDFSSGAYQNVDKNSLSLSMLGENANQIKGTISDNLGDQVSKLNINFWPFWVTSAPRNQKAVTIELKFQ